MKFRINLEFKREIKRQVLESSYDTTFSKVSEKEFKSEQVFELAFNTPEEKNDFKKQEDEREWLNSVLEEVNTSRMTASVTRYYGPCDKTQKVTLDNIETIIGNIYDINFNVYLNMPEELKPELMAKGYQPKGLFG